MVEGCCQYHSSWKISFLMRLGRHRRRPAADTRGTRPATTASTTTPPMNKGAMKDEVGTWEILMIVLRKSSLPPVRKQSTLAEILLVLSEFRR
jgi:hypothetical protein